MRERRRRRGKRGRRGDIAVGDVCMTINKVLLRDFLGLLFYRGGF